MTKFHISPDGDPRLCKAQIGKCPIAEDGAHFDSVSSAIGNYEKKRTQINPAMKRQPLESNKNTYPEDTVSSKEERVISGNWTKNSTQIAAMEGADMTHRDMQLFVLSSVSHNMHPAIGQFRLAASSGDQSSIKSAWTAKNKYVSNAASTIAVKLIGDRKANEEFIVRAIHESFDPVFSEYEKDVYSKIDLDPILDDFAVKISDYFKKS